VGEPVPTPLKLSGREREDPERRLLGCIRRFRLRARVAVPVGVLSVPPSDPDVHNSCIRLFGQRIHYAYTLRVTRGGTSGYR
jgi:hypothetical protein